MFEVDAMTALVAQVESLSKKIDGFMTPRAASVMGCKICHGGYPKTNYPIVSTSLGQIEQVE